MQIACADFVLGRTTRLVLVEIKELHVVSAKILKQSTLFIARKDSSRIEEVQSSETL